MNMKYVGILFGACLVWANGGCVVETTGSAGTAGTAGQAGAGVGGSSGDAGTAGTGGTTGGTAGTGGSMSSGGSGGTGGMTACVHCAEFVTTGGEICQDDPTAMTSDYSDFVAVIDCICAMGEGCETECKDSCPVGDKMPSVDCIMCAADFTKDANGTCKTQQDTCKNDF